MDLNKFLKTHIWLIVFIAILISFFFPEMGLPLEPYLPYLLMGLMFFSCLNIHLRDIFKELRVFKDEAMTLGIIHLVSPLLVLLLKPFLSAELFLGLIIASVMSSGMSVVFLSHLYGGIASESLLITSLSNLLSPITVPFLVWIFARTSIAIDPIAMGLTMLKLVIIPLGLAMIIRKTPLHKPLHKEGDVISLFILFLLILVIISPVKDVILDNLKISLLLSAVILILIAINFFLGYLIGKNKKEKISYAMSASYKNFTLATVIALSLFNPIVALPSIIYTVMNNLFLIPLQMIFKK